MFIDRGILDAVLIVEMATYNNKHWLLSHIRNSYIATDDTGMCEAVMLSDDLPNRFMDMCKTRRTTQPTATNKSSTSNTASTHNATASTATGSTAIAAAAPVAASTPTASKSHPNYHQHTHLPQHNSSLQSHRGYRHNHDDNFEWYPGLDQSDDEDLDPMSQSYDILMDHDHGLGLRKHNNISAPKYDKKDARRRASKVRSIKLDDNVVELNDDEIDDFFPRRNNYNTATATNTNSTTSTDDEHEKAVSLLAQRLEQVRQQPVNEFQQYSQFDGNQMSVQTKTFKIFLTMLPKEQQNYPMDVCVIATAKIQEFIGLICYRCSITYDVPLLSLQNYALYITEGDGEIDDFPPLDLREPCGKFRFSHLALVQRKEGELIKLDSRPTSETESTLDSPLSHELMMDRSGNDPKDMERMNDHTIQMEAPLYRSYHVKMVTSGPFKAHVQLGISGEKMEIDPIHTQNSKLAKQFSRLKPVSHSMETVVYCDIKDQNRSRSVIRIVYSIISDYQPQLSHSTTYYAHSLDDPNVIFRHYDFITKPAQAAEIVEKVNNIIEVRSSSNRREYLSRNPSATQKKRHTFSFRRS